MTVQEMSLASVAKMRTGKLNSNAAVPHGEYPFFTCAQQTYRIDKFAFDTEAVLLGGNNANGIYPLKYYNGKFNAYQRTYVFETLDSSVLNTRYLYYALIPALERFQSMSIGAATQYLTKSILDNFLINVPDLFRQERIVSIISNYDELIMNNKRRIVLLEMAAQQIYREWFIRVRHPGHEHELPWGSVAFREIATVRKGKNITKDAAVEGHVPVVAGGLTPAYYHNTANVSGSAVTISASGANAGYVNYYRTDIWASDCSYLAESENENLRYLYLLLKDRQVDLTSMQKGAAQPHVYPKDIDRLEVSNPPSALLSRFADWINPLFDQAARLDRQAEQLTKARDLLLPKLMSGAIAV